jgi:hypothetical protein
MAKHIIPMIVDRIVYGLTKVCITDVPYGDPTRMSGIKSGRYQEDPNQTMLRASVQGGDLENPNLMDAIVTDPTNTDNKLGFRIAPREIGGSQMWYRRGVVRLEFFFIVDNLEEELARDYAYTILGRMQNNIELIPMADLYDDNGEHAIKLFHTQNSMYQSGGPPTSYIWRGKLLWEVLTERDWS